MAKYNGPETLSGALGGARKTDRNGRHLTILQRLCSKYGIEQGQKVYSHFGIKQKKASKKGYQQMGTKSGPRSYSEGKVGGHGRSQIYRKGDRTASWTKSGGTTRRGASRGQAWVKDRGMGTPTNPVPNTPLQRKTGLAGKGKPFHKGMGAVRGRPYVESQSWERKKGD